MKKRRLGRICYHMCLLLADIVMTPLFLEPQILFQCKDADICYKSTGLAWVMKSVFRIFHYKFIFFYATGRLNRARFTLSLSLSCRFLKRQKQLSPNWFPLQRVLNMMSGTQWVHILRWYKFVVNSIPLSHQIETVKLWTYFWFPAS